MTFYDVFIHVCVVNSDILRTLALITSGLIRCNISEYFKSAASDYVFILLPKHDQFSDMHVSVPETYVFLLKYVVLR